MNTLVGAAEHLAEILKRRVFWLLMTVLLAISFTFGCTPSRVVPVLDMVDEVVDKEADTALGFVIRQLCSTPVDWLAVGSDEPDMARAIWYGCPEVRRFALNMVQAVNQGAATSMAGLPAILNTMRSSRDSVREGLGACVIDNLIEFEPAAGRIAMLNCVEKVLGPGRDPLWTLSPTE